MPRTARTDSKTAVLSINQSTSFSTLNPHQPNHNHHHHHHHHHPSLQQQQQQQQSITTGVSVGMGLIETETAELNSACPQADGASLREGWGDVDEGGREGERGRQHYLQQLQQTRRMDREQQGKEKSKGGHLFSWIRRK